MFVYCYNTFLNQFIFTTAVFLYESVFKDIVRRGKRGKYLRKLFSISVVANYVFIYDKPGWYINFFCLFLNGMPWTLCLFFFFLYRFSKNETTNCLYILTSFRTLMFFLNVFAFLNKISHTFLEQEISH